MNEEVKQAIKTIVSHSQWPIVEAYIKERLTQVSDIHTINLQRPMEEIGGETLARFQAVKFVESLLKDFGMISKADGKPKPNKYK